MKRAYIAVVHAFISVVCGLQNFCETTGIVGRLRTKLLDNVRLKYPDEAIIEHNSIIPDLVRIWLPTSTDRPYTCE